MSEELHDEVEAINSIYGDGSLVPADDAAGEAVYILRLPVDASSLRLSFAADYPASPPSVLATHHSSGGKRGAGARDLALFRAALGEVFEPAVVCLFDAVEEFARRREEEDDDAPEPESEPEPDHPTPEPATDVDAFPPAAWTASELVVDSKSTFVAHVARVTSPAQARHHVSSLLASDRRFRSATHNMTAWRIRGPGGASFQDCDDDGEAAAGGRLLHLMQLMDVWDAMVVVSRWYGGVKLGPRRFAVINAAARDGFVRAGLVEDKDKDKKRGK
ncbi:ribosomal protein S5 domain 2-type protein [Dactylonectria estremocensis]|uniref:Ribosomal protein S5 domain 2-type protein n=1 Tax=Dactylonectria estremocensis TaxID=1079267 RepID=A0A9P9F4S4_9HYPO|nr:ribosomal protein S5 domain 2-type protein [Dactylonectria estremocensis]